MKSVCTATPTSLSSHTQSTINNQVVPISNAPTDDNPLISVIVPIYNTERYLDQCLTSIEQQTYRNLEIICLNDGSTDSSLEIIQRHAAQDARIRVVDKENQGYGATCNRGLDEAYGEYLAIVEPDDWIEPRMYEDMIRFAQQFKDGKPIDIVKTPYWRIWMPDTPTQRKLNCAYKNRIHPYKQPFALKDSPKILHHHPSIWSALYRKQFLDNRGIRFREFPGAGWADNPFLIETLCQTNRIVYLDTPYYCYREDTPEKSAAFALTNTLLPLERWNDMKDVMDRLGIEDPEILKAIYCRGFTYLSGIIEEVDLTHDYVRDAAIHMFSRMDPELVFSNENISPGCKRMFAELRGIPCPKIDKLGYLKGLIQAGLYNIENTGVYNTFFATTNFLKKRKIRTGGR